MSKIPSLYPIVHYFFVFRRYTGRMIFVLVAVMLATGLTEGVGVTLFLPLLDQANVSGSSGGIIMDAYTRLFDYLGIPLTLQAVLWSILIFALLKLALMVTQGTLAARIEAQFAARLRETAVAAYSRLDYRQYLEYDTGQLNNLLTMEIPRATFAFATYFNVLVSLISKLPLSDYFRRLQMLS